MVPKSSKKDAHQPLYLLKIVTSNGITGSDRKNSGSTAWSICQLEFTTMFLRYFISSPIEILINSLKKGIDALLPRIRP